MEYVGACSCVRSFELLAKGVRPRPVCTTRAWQCCEANLERTFARDSYEQMGGYVKRCRGLTMFVKIENPAGHRIDRLFIEGYLAEPDRTYRAAFITQQGVPKKFGRNRKNLDISAIEAMQRYLGRQKVTVVEPRDTVIAV